MKKFRLLIITVSCVLSLLAGASAAQQNQVESELPKLALEIYSFDASPNYQQVGEWAWSSQFRRVESWQPPAGSTPVKAVKVASKIKKGFVQITISVFLGVRFHDREETVATYRVRENETIIANELKQYGVQPLTIKVVNVISAVARQPSVTNKTNSIAVAGIKTGGTIFPSFMLTLRNISDKSVRALKVQVVTAGGEKFSIQPRSLDETPLIEPGAFYDARELHAEGGRLTAEGLLPDAPQNITIATALFTDGTYEGDPVPAAHIKALLLGRKIQLTKAAALLRKTSAADNLDPDNLIENFKTQVSALDEDMKQVSLDDLLAEFPAFDQRGRNELRGVVAFALHNVKINLLADVKNFEKAHQPRPSVKEFQAWLAETAENYEKIIGRL